MAEQSAPLVSNTDVLSEALRLLDARLAARFEATEGAPGRAAEPGLLGLVITDEEVRETLRQGSLDGSLLPTGSVWREVSDRIGHQVSAGSPLKTVADRFGLLDFEVDCLIVCLAAEVDSKYQKVFSYLNDDVTRKYPSADLLLRLFGSSAAERLDLGRCLLSQAPLFRSRLVRWVEENHQERSTPRPRRCLSLEPGVVHFLLGEPVLSEALEAVRPHELVPPEAVSLWTDSRELEAAIERLCGCLLGAGGEPADRQTVVLSGRPGSGRAFALERACERVGAGLIAIDCRRLLRSHEPEVILEQAFRDSALHMAPILLTCCDHLVAGPQTVGGRSAGGDLLLSLERLTALQGWLLFALVDRPSSIRQLFRRQQRIEVDLPVPGLGVRKRMWMAMVSRLTEELTGKPSEPLPAPDLLAENLAAKFRLTPGQIGEVCARAAVEARRNGSRLDWSRLLHDTASQASAPDLGRLAQRLEPVYTWEDIVLPPARLELLRDIVRRVHWRRKVREEWSFEKAMSRAAGVNVLFSGPPGTGKTMAAEVVSNELGMDVYRIDLASVVSKYIGETEKNLGRIFEEADQSDAILFFDEADALFGKRSEVRDAHDRYSNIEINYLLQQLEAFRGLAILATNLRQNLDEAFLRRLQIVLEFPVPTAEDRLRIWEKILPREAPLDVDVDLEFLAEAFEFTGGSIRNVILTAAFLGADDGESIGMRHLVQATCRELEKSGKRSLQERFGVYGSLVAQEEDNTRPRARSRRP